jgi:hypothetical protein
MKGSENAALAENEHGAGWIGFTKEFGGVQCRGVKMPSRNSRDAEMLQADGEIFGSRRRVVGEEKKWSARRGERLHEIRRSGNQMILPVDHSIHVNEITRFHCKGFCQVLAIESH